MAYSSSLPGLSEAAPDALIGILVANLTQLNSILSHDALTTVPTVTSAQILLGDGEAIPSYDFWIAVRNGSRSDGEEITSEFELTDVTAGYGFKNTYSATICVYANPNAVFDSDPLVHEATRHRLLSRVSDWIRRDCFNTRSTANGATDGQLITLGSREYSTAPAYDTLKGGHISAIHRGETPKAPGERVWVPTVQHEFQSWLQ